MQCEAEGLISKKSQGSKSRGPYIAAIVMKQTPKILNGV